MTSGSDGVVTVSLDGTTVVSGEPLTASIANVVVYSIRHRGSSGTTYEFGTVELGYVSVCY